MNETNNTNEAHGTTGTTQATANAEKLSILLEYGESDNIPGITQYKDGDYNSTKINLHFITEIKARNRNIDGLKIRELTLTHKDGSKTTISLFKSEVKAI